MRSARSAKSAPRTEGSPRLDLPERYVLYVGTDRPHKNLPRLLRAWAAIDPAFRRGCHLVVAGANESRGAGNDSLFLGFVDEADLPRVYHGAQMLVHPALQEGFGLTVVEAMASGVPVACSSSPSLDPVCGDAALRFDPRDVGAIAAAIERLLQDVELRDRLIAAGTARAAELSWARTAELTLRAYRRAARHAATATSA